MTDPSIQTHKQSWRDWAACIDCDTSLFYNTAGATAKTAIAEAKRICRRCPVQLMCLNDALDNRDRHGIWGGRTPEERRLMLRRLGRSTWRRSDNDR